MSRCNQADLPYLLHVVAGEDVVAAAVSVVVDDVDDDVVVGPGNPVYVSQCKYLVVAAAVLCLDANAVYNCLYHLDAVLARPFSSFSQCIYSTQRQVSKRHMHSRMREEKGNMDIQKVGKGPKNCKKLRPARKPDENISVHCQIHLLVSSLLAITSIEEMMWYFSCKSCFLCLNHFSHIDIRAPTLVYLAGLLVSW